MGSSNHDQDCSEYQWNPGRFAIAFDRFEHPSGQGRTSIVASHPTAPFVPAISAAWPWTDEILQGGAYRYLGALNSALETRGDPAGLGLPAGWLEALDPDHPNEFFGWLPIEPPSDAARDEKESGKSLSSLRLLRDLPADEGSDNEQDTTIILVAGEKLPDGKGGHPTNSDFGLRVVMHLARDGEGTRASIGAMTAYLPYAPYATLLEIQPQGVDQQELAQMRQKLRDLKLDFRTLTRLVKRNNVEIARQAQLLYEKQNQGLLNDKLRFLPVADEVWVEVSGLGNGALGSDADSAPYSYTVRLPFHRGAGKSLQLVSKHPMTADAGGPAPGMARVFEQDPSSWRDLDDLHSDPSPYRLHARRPTRSESELDRFRRLERIGSGRRVPLETPDFVVRNCSEFVPGDPDNARPKTVSLPPGKWPEVRSNDQTAINAYWTCNEVFSAMRGLGLDPARYFRASEHPIDVFYRSGIRPGPGKDGKTVNARVMLKLQRRRRALSRSKPRVEIHLALANLTHRARRSGRAVPLGIANAERWIWHEFGHVLIAACLGELEFRFAHSVGDGLAAVWADPFSRLADPRDMSDRQRGMTFPWVFLTRRHDRCVLSGWSWSGTFQHPVTEAPERVRKGLKGYLSEQILSSTLFRLYRILGGDTVDVEDGGPDYPTRETASLVVLYLTFRGIESFAITPVRAEELEAAMIDADLGLTHPLGLTLRSRPSTPSYPWHGGLAHKAVRWAFEAQGLHPPDPAAIHNGPGLPPPVDIYIEDRRPTLEQTDGGAVAHRPGGYLPVSLDWAGERLWHAGSAAGSLSDFPVVVRNRGSRTAEQVSARFWIGHVGGDPATRDWDRTSEITWVFASPDSATAQSVPAGGEVGLSIQAKTPELPSSDNRSVIVLVEVTCPDDRANSDPAAGLPCAVSGQPPSLPRGLADLVANDNNLGLWMLP